MIIFFSFSLNYLLKIFFLLDPQPTNVQLSRKISVTELPALIFCLKCIKKTNEGDVAQCLCEVGAHTEMINHVTCKH